MDTKRNLLGECFESVRKVVFRFKFPVHSVAIALVFIRVHSWLLPQSLNRRIGNGTRAGTLAGVLLAIYKPYGVLSQFTPEPGSQWRTLADFALPKAVYPLGRLDADSEGLLLLSDEAGLNSRLLDPAFAHRREYWVQVERVPDAAALTRLRAGVMIGDYCTRPCDVRRLLPEPQLAPRSPPIRVRKNVPDCWLALELTEGKNRQVRRMTAAVGHPTLRLVRVRIGALTLESLALAPGQWRELTPAERTAVFVI